MARRSLPPTHRFDSGRRAPARGAVALAAGALALALGASAALSADDDLGERHEAAFATITEGEVEAHVRYLASEKLRGRNTPSRGLELAAEHVAAVFAAAGLVAAPDASEAWQRHGGGTAPEWSMAPAGGTYLRPFRYTGSGGRNAPALSRPVPERCALELALEGEEPQVFAFGDDFVPVAECDGDVRGELVFCGFGISSKSHKYDDFRGRDLKGKVALVLEGEPRHKRKFDGEEVTAESSYWNKLDKIAATGVAGVIFVRRPPAAPKRGEAPEPAPLDYRYSNATWNPPSLDRARGEELAAIEVTSACATRLLGEDVEALAERIDRSARPVKVKAQGRQVSFRAATEESAAVVHNVVGVVEGSDANLKDEYVVVGAHYDHIGVGPRGRIGYGADDNASGTACLLEIAQALAAARPRRSVLVCAFSGEEKGLLGSREIAQQPPVPRERLVGMVNLDMVGFGDAREVVLMGVRQNPGFEALAERAKRLEKTGIRKLSVVNDEGLFQRSDHYSFHQAGIPALFLFEGYPIEANRNYHSYRDTPDYLDMEKMANTARLAFNVVWLLASDDERLPAPRD